MIITKTDPYCPHCHTKGTVISHMKNQIMLECPKDKKTWVTLSETCPDCGSPNGFAFKGPCTKCYSDRYRIS